MKFTIEIDATPQEARQVMGLPDVKEAQDRVIARMEEIIKPYMDGRNPAELLRIIMPEGLSAFDTWTKAVWDHLSGAPGSGSEKD